MNEITKAGFDYKTVESKEARNSLKQQSVAIKAAIRRSQNDIIEIGTRLNDAKEEVDHGTFMDWCQSEFDMSHTTVWKFMNVAKTFGKFSHCENLNIQQSALYALSSPSVPEEAREEAIKIAATGETVTHAKAQEIKAKHTPKKEPAPKTTPQDFKDVDDTDPYADDGEEDVFDSAQVPVIIRDDITPEATPLKPAKPESDLTDPEWLMTIPTFRYMVTNNIPAIILRNDLLSWRTLENLGTFNKIKMAIGKSFKAGNGYTNFEARLQNAVVKHPKHWGGCVKCRAHGCADCTYTGADVTGGLTIEQLEGK